MQNIGERLEEARKRKGISIREAAEATKVRGDYLHKFESNQFDINLPDIYVRGFLRNYAGYLGLPPEKVVNDYNALGHATSAKPKSLNREIYGRMDLSVSSSKDSGREDGDLDHSDDANSDNPATFKPKPSSVPYVDKALIIKGGILLTAVVALVLLVVFGIRAFSGGEETAEVSDPAPIARPVTSPGDGQVAVFALADVVVKLVDEQSNQEIYQGPIPGGEYRLFPKSGTLLLTANLLENVEVEIGGTRYNLTEETQGLRGRQRVRVP